LFTTTMLQQNGRSIFTKKLRYENGLRQKTK